MSYDFVVVRPAELEVVGLTPPVTDASITTFFERFGDEGGEAPPSLADFRRELLERVPFGSDESSEADAGHWLMVEPSAQPHLVAVCSSWHFVPQAFATTLELSSQRGLAVLDPQARILFDPTDSVQVDVLADGGLACPYLSRSLLDQLVTLAAAKDGFIVVCGDGDYVYVQTRYAQGTFEIEHRSAEDRHFASTTTDAALVAEIIWSWVSGGDGWATSLPWQRISV